MKRNNEIDHLHELFDELEEVTPSPQLKQHIMQRVYAEVKIQTPLNPNKSYVWIAALAGFICIFGLPLLIFSYFEITIAWEIPKLTFSPLLLCTSGSIMLLLLIDLLLGRSIKKSLPL